MCGDIEAAADGFPTSGCEDFLCPYATTQSGWRCRRPGREKMPAKNGLSRLAHSQAAVAAQVNHEMLGQQQLIAHVYGADRT